MPCVFRACVRSSQDARYVRLVRHVYVGRDQQMSIVSAVLSIISHSGLFYKLILEATNITVDERGVDVHTLG